MTAAETQQQKQAEREQAMKEIAALPDWKAQQDFIRGAMSRCTAGLVQQADDVHGKPIDTETMGKIRSTVDRLDMFRQEYDRLAELNDGSLLATARKMAGAR